MSELTAWDKKLIGEQLTDRYFVKRTQGSQTFYWDSKTGHEVQKMHLVDVALQMLPKGFQGLETAKQIINSQYFRPIVDYPVFKPNAPQIVEIDGHRRPNVWVEPLVTPAPEIDAEPFLRHLLFVLGEQSKVDYLVDMLAFRYQYPHKPKPHIAFYFYGEQGGAGKTTFAKTLSHVFGSESLKTANTVKSLSDKGAVDLWSRSWLIIEEASIGKGTSLYDNIKSYTGADYVDADKKFKAVSKHRIPAQLIMMSNRAPTFIEENDRRFFVSKWHLPIEGTKERQWYFSQYIEWLETDGYQAIAGHLKTRHIVADPYQPAPMTFEKEQALAFQVDPVVEEIRDFLERQSNDALFVLDNFGEIWKKHHVKHTVWKHKLADAGLLSYGRMLISGKQPNVWYRASDEIVRARGRQPTVIRLKDGRELTPYKALCLISPIL